MDHDVAMRTRHPVEPYGHIPHRCKCDEPPASGSMEQQVEFLRRRVIELENWRKHVAKILLDLESGGSAPVDE